MCVLHTRPVLRPSAGTAPQKLKQEDTIESKTNIRIDIREIHHILRR